MTPPARRLAQLMDELLQSLVSGNVHSLIASSALHYECEFIHPFVDGRDRIYASFGRFAKVCSRPILLKKSILPDCPPADG
ncbi:MAG: Fic family protein [Pseudomonas sp.]